LKTASFEYDFEQRRKTDGYGEFTQWYVFDGSSLLAEVNASDSAMFALYSSLPIHGAMSF